MMRYTETRSKLVKAVARTTRNSNPFTSQKCSKPCDTVTFRADNVAAAQLGMVLSSRLPYIALCTSLWLLTAQIVRLSN